MAVDYKETEVPEGDLRSEMLDDLADGRPWVLVTARSAGAEDLSLTVECGGGITDSRTVRSLLTKTLDAFPAEPADE